MNIASYLQITIDMGDIALFKIGGLFIDSLCNYSEDDFKSDSSKFTPLMLLITGMFIVFTKSFLVMNKDHSLNKSKDSISMTLRLIFFRRINQFSVFSLHGLKGVEAKHIVDEFDSFTNDLTSIVGSSNKPLNLFMVLLMMYDLIGWLFIVYFLIFYFSEGISSYLYSINSNNKKKQVFLMHKRIK